MRRRWLFLAAPMVALGYCLAFLYTAMRFCGWLLLAAASLTLLWGVSERFRGRKTVLILRRIFLAALALGLLLFSVLELQVIRYGRTDYDREAAAVIVLGAGVNGRIPSLSLQVRLEAALDYAADRPEIPIVVTGGQGPGEEITEARCMADWLMARGVAEERILLEEQAVNTEQNICYSLALLAENGVDTTANIAVVSADYHLYRASLYWGTPSMVPVAAHMPERFWPLTVNYYIREAFGVAAILAGVDSALSALT